MPLGHNEESQLATTAPMTGARRNRIMTTEDESSSVTYAQFVVLEETQHVSVWPEPRILGSVPGAGHGATADVTNSTMSLD